MKHLEKRGVSCVMARTEENHSAKKRTWGLFEFSTFVLMLAFVVWLISQLRTSPVSILSDESFYGDPISDGDEFDYIVIGAGTAGIAVAARLSLGGMRVLLVEAGGDPNVLATIPGSALLLAGSTLDWHYQTLSNNKSCLGTTGKSCRFSGGRCIGGSSSINFMLYSRGNRNDFDFNIPGWTWKDIEPYFLRYEGLYDLHRLPKSSVPYHNTSGILPIGFFGDYMNAWRNKIIKGMQTLNIPYNPDVSGLSQIGVSRLPGYIKGGERVSVAKAYLEQKKVREKITIVKNTRCTNIMVGEDNVARGVTVTQGFNKTLSLYVKHEIVLSAGTIATPQILMLSGIGPKKHLQQMGIKVKADLPVGKRMSDHACPIVYVQSDDELASSSLFSSIGLKGLQAAQWFATRGGPLATISLTDLTMFINTKCYNYTLGQLQNNRPECEVPSLQLIFCYADKGLGRIFEFAFKNSAFSLQSEEIKNQVFLVNDKRSFIAVAPLNLRPKSRGWVRLASSDPSVPPDILPNYLDDERDLEEMVRSLRFLEHFVATLHNSSILYLTISGCPAPGESGYWECYARHMTQSGHHAVGTAALGKVVDERLRVKGIRKLRIADASVLPHLPRGNTAAAVIAIGERLSDFLLEDRRLR